MRIIILAALLALSACAHNQPCSFEQWAIDSNCS